MTVLAETCSSLIAFVAVCRAENQALWNTTLHVIRSARGLSFAECMTNQLSRVCNPRQDFGDLPIRHDVSANHTNNSEDAFPVVFVSFINHVISRLLSNVRVLTRAGHHRHFLPNFDGRQRGSILRYRAQIQPLYDHNTPQKKGKVGGNYRVELFNRQLICPNLTPIRPASTAAEIDRHNLVKSIVSQKTELRVLKETFANRLQLTATNFS